MSETIKAITGLINSPAFWGVLKLLFGIWIAATLIGMLPMPAPPNGSKWMRVYRVVFMVLNTFAANAKRALHALKLEA